MSFNIYSTMTQTIPNKSADRKAIEAFVKTLTELLVYLITLSFYSNTLVSRTFRKELIILLKLIITCGHYQRRSRIVPSNNTGTRNNTLQVVTSMKIARTSMPKVG